VSTYAYDSAGHISSITHTKGASTLLSFAYTYDDAGRRTSVTTAEGTENYSYDALGRLTQVSYPGGLTVSYTYDAAGNRKTETRGGSTTNYDYDAAGQLVTVGNKTYTYDANGNLTQAGSDSFTWDYDSRLTQTTVANHTASYTYDGDGVRVGATVDGASRSFLVDANGGLPKVVDDGSRTYLHADGVFAEVDSTTATQLLGDAIGSVRGLADNAGSLVGSSSYEAFGATRTSTGSTSLFGFTGEPTDATGLVYLRARYLDASTGRFLSGDSMIPNAPGTQGFNPYAHVANNPTTWTDPTGHNALALAVAPWLVPGAGEILLAAGVVALTVLACYVMAQLLECLILEGCFAAALEFAQTIVDAGVDVVDGVIDWVIEKLRDAIRWFPPIPMTVSIEATTSSTVRAGQPQTCQQGVIHIGGDGAAHVDARHTSPAQRGRKSVFFAEDQWRELVREAQSVVAIPDIARPDFCIRAAQASHDIGVDKDRGLPTAMYAVITRLDGTLWTTYPGIPVAWYGQ
jgi:RHS repeat-associated protein